MRRASHVGGFYRAAVARRNGGMVDWKNPPRKDWGQL
jgi:hypothetical protein